MAGSFFHFLLLTLYKNRFFHATTLLMAAVLIFLLASGLFVVGSLQKQTFLNLAQQPEFVVRKLRGGRPVATDEQLLYALQEIRGVTAVRGRVHGRYDDPVFEDTGFELVGIDIFEPSLTRTLRKLTAREFEKLSPDQMLVSPAVKELLRQNYYESEYLFHRYEGGTMRMEIAGVIDRDYALQANDVMLLPMEKAREVLGLPYGTFTDIALEVPNELELDTIKQTILSRYANVEVIDKRKMAARYQTMYDMKSGVFLSLFTVVLLGFVLILYFKYSHVLSSAKREIGILRSLGWSINDLLRLKGFETLCVGSVAFMGGFIAAFIYVYGADAPLLGRIFLGYGELPVDYDFKPFFDPGLFAQLYLLFIIPFSAAVIVPVWRLCIIGAKEAMK